MVKKSIVIICIVFVMGLLSCKKDKDTVTVHNINGMVYNNCTDSGLANVTVFLNTNDGKNTSTSQTVSDVNGNFTFANINIHSNSKYTYAIYIPSKSGINGAGGTEVGFNGATLNFNNDDVAIFFKPRVTPQFLLYVIYCQPLIITNNIDSVSFTCYNYTYHKNVPIYYPYHFGGGGYGNGSYTNNTGSYPMGKYNITIESWKSGIYSIKQDSVYLGWGSTTSYTVNW